MRRAAERAAASRSPAKRPDVAVKVGMRCRAKYLASSLPRYTGLDWFTGVVDAINEDGTFAVVYDDGDYESGIKRRFLKVELEAAS